ncbi:pimeloyl-[acyl-carrier protein] methyl ester esterase [Methylococcaceae bacterium HT1]|nr:pimeloyl-[acyl-carrier protein] methyl ester esterase [Methylococcaceae bacterium HT1]TXL23106.1 pimeloyl-[acyl-carrier protein] methyl ester esterase [Methylococcaceae bacterium HT2]
MTAWFQDKLHKEVYGHGEPIVMLHGWAMHTGRWRDFAKALAGKNQVMCLDLPGHGLSASITPYTLESVVDAVYAQLPEHACVLIGWSLGGNVALRLAEKYPQKIKSLVLIASNPHFMETKNWPGVQADVLQLFTNNLQKNPAPTLLRFMSIQVQEMDDKKASLKQIKQALQECAPSSPEVLMAGLGILQAVDQRKILSSLRIPVMMILGELDTLVPVSVGEQCQLLQARLEVHLIAGAGHIPFITDQKQLLALIHDFTRRSDCNA